MRVMIVEDERMIRQGLMRHIKWKELEIEEVCAASNAAEALELAKQFRPDIVLSDIRMPGMDGIELCRRIRADYPEVELILITGFSEKDYLKAAIDLHVVGFVEKPINLTILTRLILEAVENVRKNQQQNVSFAQDLIWDAASGFTLNEHYAVFNVALVTFQDENSLRRVKKVLSEELTTLLDGIGIQVRMNQISERMLTLLFASNHTIADHFYFADILKVFFINALRGADNEKWYVGIGRDCSGYEHLSESYYQAQKASDTLAWQDWQHLAFYHESFESNLSKFPPDLHDPFQRASELHDTKRMLQILDGYVSQLINGRFTIEPRIRYTFFDMERILERDNRIEEEERDSYARAFETLETLHEMQQKLRELIEKTGSAQGGLENSGTIRKVVEYMEQNYGDPGLSISILAEEVYLTPTYLSSLFKKNTGKTIGQYLLDIRLKHAMELMKNQKLKFYQIAREVGYEDANYFAKIFKKKTGLTPSEYKEHMNS